MFACVAYACGALAQSDNIHIRVEGETGKLNVPVYRLAITSSNGEFATLARRAFGLHGSFRLVNDASQAQLHFHFEPAGAASVKVSIKKGSNFQQVCSGSDNVDALLKACDAAVKHTLRTPGFFGGKLAFSYSKNGGKTSEICVSDMVFRNVRAVTKDNSNSLMPHLSPDCSKLTYTGYFRSGFMDLYLVDMATRTRKTLASYKGSNTGGSFSPDGGMIAMILSGTGNAEVWTVRSTGRHFKRITRTPSTESSPSFSPDGTKLIFAGDAMGKPQIYTTPVNGGKAVRVRTNISRYCSEPTWNPVDPAKIAFTAAEGRGFQVAVYDFNTRKTRVISRGASTSYPKWLSDGRHLVCMKTEGARRQLYIIDSETGIQKPLHSAGFGSCAEPDFAYPNNR